MKASELSFPVDSFTEIGHGIRIQPLLAFDAEEAGSDEVIGFVVGHTHPDGHKCDGAVHINRDAHPVWQVVRVKPLSLHPSIHVPSCGLHGFVTDGKWIPV